MNLVYLCYADKSHETNEDNRSDGCGIYMFKIVIFSLWIDLLIIPAFHSAVRPVRLCKGVKIELHV